MGKKNSTTTKTATTAKRAAKPTEDSQPTGRKMISAPAKPLKKTVSKPKAATKQNVPGFTTNDIALRAYYIAEKRRNEGIPGDEHQDWIEAERQLAAESKAPKKTAS